jgi:hypothetical protein
MVSTAKTSSRAFDIGFMFFYGTPWARTRTRAEGLVRDGGKERAAARFREKNGRKMRRAAMGLSAPSRGRLVARTRRRIGLHRAGMSERTRDVFLIFLFAPRGGRASRRFMLRRVLLESLARAARRQVILSCRDLGGARARQRASAERGQPGARLLVILAPTFQEQPRRPRDRRGDHDRWSGAIATRTAGEVARPRGLGPRAFQALSRRG